MTAEELKKRLKDWAIVVVVFTRKLPNSPEFRAVKNQLVGSLLPRQRRTTVHLADESLGRTF